MSRYEVSRTNGSYSGLSLYHGLGDGRGGGRRRDDWQKWRKKAPPPPLQRPMPTLSSQAQADILQQKSIMTGQKAAALEKQGGAALAAGYDKLAKGLLAKAEKLQHKSAKQATKAEMVRLPYTNDPMVPQAIQAMADKAAFENPIAIADQQAPMPGSAMPLPGPLSLPMPHRVVMPPVWVPGRPIGSPLPPPQYFAPPPPAPISHANLATAAAALAAGYFLFL